MGRALLIITLGSFIILGIIQRAVTNRQLTMTEGNIEAFMVSHAQNATGSALELAINRIIYDDNWGDAPQRWEYELSDMLVQVQIDNHDVAPDSILPTELRVTSWTQFGNRTVRSFAFLDRNTANLPDMLGAVSVYGENSRIRLDGVGAQLKIDGNDTHPLNTIEDDLDDDIAGIASVTDSTTLFSEISGAASNKIFYDGEPAYDENPEMDQKEIEDLYDEYVEIGTTYIADGNLGTDESPVINVIDGEATLGGRDFGSGVLVIKPGSELTISGNFTYHGLILVAGKLEITGTPNIYGGVILMDTGLFEDPISLIQDPDEDQATLSGTPGIIYSSWVLNNLSRYLTGSDGRPWAFNRISY